MGREINPSPSFRFDQPIMPHITIIGGGISGLATAFYLQKKGQEIGLPINYTLLEAAPRFGGTIVTEQVDKFVIEGGPDSFITQKPWALQLCRDLDISHHLIPTNDRQRNVFILRQGRLIPFPAGYRLAVPTQFMPFALSPLISPLGKLRMGLDLFIPRRRQQGDESLASFMRRRLGQEALEMIAEPLMAGIYNTDSERMSMQSTFPMFTALERRHGSLIKAMQIAKWTKWKQARQTVNPPSTNGHGKPAAMFNSFRNGMADLTTHLVQALDGDLRLSCPVKQIERQAQGFHIQLNPTQGPSFSTDAVVITTPASAAVPLVAPFQPQLAAALNEIRYTSTATLSLGFRRSDIRNHLDGFGFLVPKRERRYLSACTWSSNKFAHRADADHVLLRIFLGGPGREHLVDLPDDDLLTLARMELLTILGITAKPVIHRLYRWSQGRPQYEVGHLERVTRLEALAAETTGLYLTSSSLRGIGIPDCVKSAQACVAQIIRRYVD